MQAVQEVVNDASLSLNFELTHDKVLKSYFTNDQLVSAGNQHSCRLPLMLCHAMPCNATQ